MNHSIGMEVLVSWHSLLNLLIREENCCELKGRGLKEFQYKLKGVKYILIEEFSVIDKEMFRWVDRRLRQARVNLTYNFVFYFS